MHAPNHPSAFSNPYPPAAPRPISTHVVLPKTHTHTPAAGLTPAPRQVIEKREARERKKKARKARRLTRVTNVHLAHLLEGDAPVNIETA